MAAKAPVTPEKSLDEALRAAKEAQAMLTMRAARDKKQGRSAAWFAPRPLARWSRGQKCKDRRSEDVCVGGTASLLRD